MNASTSKSTSTRAEADADAVRRGYHAFNTADIQTLNELLDPQATCDWLHSAQSSTLIHGHTHRPAEHDLANGLRRIVLSDWDASATPPRVEILRLSRDLPHQEEGSEVQRITLAVAA